MKRLRNIILFLFGIVTSLTFAQDNPFLKRDFWKTNPSPSVIDKTIALGNDPSELNANGFDGVVYALLEGADNASIKHLQAKDGNNVNKLTHDGRTYIFWAAYKNNLEMMQHFVEQDAKLDVRDDHGNTVLTFAASTGQTNPELFDFLLKHGASIQETNRSGANALLLVAPGAENFSDLQYFIDKGLSLNSEDEEGNGIFNYVAKTGNIDMLKTLQQKGVSSEGLNYNNGNAMLFAAQGTRGHSNSVDFYNYLESVGVSPNVTTKQGNTPLHTLAYRSDDLNVYRYFVEKGVSIDQENEEGQTALWNASGRNSVEILQYLVEQGADVTAANEEGITPLMRAVAGNTSEVVGYLIEHGANVLNKDNDGNSMAYYLLQSYSDRNAAEFSAKWKMLQQEGLSLSEEQANGNNAYHLAVDKNSLSFLKILKTLNVSADINAKNDEGLTPLHVAAMKATDATIMKYLIAQGADATATTDFEETAFDLASENEQLEANKTELKFLQK